MWVAVLLCERIFISAELHRSWSMRFCAPSPVFLAVSLVVSFRCVTLLAVDMSPFIIMTGIMAFIRSYVKLSYQISSLDHMCLGPAQAAAGFAPFRRYAGL